MKIYYILLAILFWAAAVQPTTIRVPQDYSEIQSAINAAQDGDTVLVSRGRYTENINFRGKGIILTSNFIFSYDLEDIDSTIIDRSEQIDQETASCAMM